MTIMTICPCFSSQNKYNVETSWQGRLFSALAFVETFVLIGLNIVLTDAAFKHNDHSSSQFYNVCAFFILAFFLHESCRAIDKESKVELWISVSLSFVISIWLTSHLVDPQAYEQEIFNIMGKVITFIAWFCSLVYLPLGYAAGKKFGYRTWNKVGGLAQNQNTYAATSEFRSLLRLDSFMFTLASATAWFYVFRFTRGLICCLIFAVWTVGKDVWTALAIKRGYRNQVRIFLFTTVDGLIMFVITIVCDYVWNDTSDLRNLIYIYFTVGLGCLITRVVVVIFARRALEETRHLSMYHDPFQDQPSVQPP